MGQAVARAHRRRSAGSSRIALSFYFPARDQPRRLCGPRPLLSVLLPSSVLPATCRRAFSSYIVQAPPCLRSPLPKGRSVDDPVGQLRGVDAKTSARLERLDVATVRDLLYLFPRRHEDYSNVVTVSEIVPGQECTVIATVWESRVVAQGAKGRRKDTEAVLGDETGNVRAIWFGQQYIARTLKPGSALLSPSAASRRYSGDSRSSTPRRPIPPTRRQPQYTPAVWLRFIR